MKRTPVIGGAIVIMAVGVFGIVQAGWLAVVPMQKAASAAPDPTAALSALAAAAKAVSDSQASRAALAPPASAANPTMTVIPQDLAAATKPTACANPNGMGIARVVEIDTTGGPGFGFQHFKTYDFLRDHEVVLTFDDGPWPSHTRAVLNALADRGIRHLDMPLTPFRIWQALREANESGHGRSPR